MFQISIELIQVIKQIIAIEVVFGLKRTSKLLHLLKI